MGGKSIELERGRSDAYLHEGDTLFSEINNNIEIPRRFRKLLNLEEK